MKTVDALDHPLPFLLAITIAVFAVRAFAKWGFARLGWSGPLAFFS